MTVNASTSGETDGASELYSIVADVAATYSDPHGKYLTFLSAGEPTYATDAFFLWDRPLPGGEKESAGLGKNGTSGGSSAANKNSSVSVIKGGSLFSAMLCATVAVGSILWL
jgi:hypothetical protein